MYKYMYFSTSGEEVYTYVIRNWQLHTTGTNGAISNQWIQTSGADNRMGIIIIINSAPCYEYR